MKYEMSIAYAYFICFIIKCSKNWFGNQCILLYLKGLFGAWLLTKLGRTWTCQLTHSDSFVLHSGSMGHGNSGITKKNPVSGFFSFFHVFLIALLRSNCSNLDTTATTNLALSIKSDWYKLISVECVHYILQNLYWFCYIWYEFTTGHNLGFLQLIWSSYIKYTLVHRPLVYM